MNAPVVIYKKTQHGIFEYFNESRELIRGQYWLFLGIAVVGILMASLVPFAVLMGPMMCGIYSCYLKKARNEEFKFDHLFKGFDYFLESFLATLIWTGFFLAALIPLGIIAVLIFIGLGYAFHQEDASLKVAIIAILVLFVLFCLLFFCLIGVPLQFAYLLIVEYKLKSWDAIKTAFNACLDNLSRIVGLGVAIMLLSWAGICCCYVGAFFLMPLSFGAYFSAYRDIFEPFATPVEPSVQV
jgi:hypothetical protein